MTDSRSEIFISYDTNDTDNYQINKFVDLLEKESKFVSKVYFWERDTELGQKFNDYMKENIKKSDLIIFFCSHSALESEAVKKEIHFAEAFDKNGIPIFEKEQDIPSDLKSNRGVQFNTSNFDLFYKEFYKLFTGEEKDLQNYQLLLQKFKNNLPAIETLYSWTLNTTGISSSYSVDPWDNGYSQGMIVKVLKFRYHYDDFQISDLQKSMKIAFSDAWIDFKRGYLDIGKNLKEEIEKNYGEILGNNFMTKFFNLSHEIQEKVFSLLYAYDVIQTKFYGIHDHSLNDKKSEFFQIIEKAHDKLFSTDFEQNFYSDMKVFIEIGMVYPAEGISVKGNKRLEYVIPQYIVKLKEKILTDMNPS